jgi:hypothetical protein
MDEVQKLRDVGIIPINPLQETELRKAILAAGGRRVIGREAIGLSVVKVPATGR